MFSSPEEEKGEILKLIMASFEFLSHNNGINDVAKNINASLIKIEEEDEPQQQLPEL